MTFRIVIFASIVAIGALIKVMNTNTSMTYIIALAVVLVLIILCMPRFQSCQKLLDKLN